MRSKLANAARSHTPLAPFLSPSSSSSCSPPRPPDRATFGPGGARLRSAQTRRTRSTQAALQCTRLLWASAPHLLATVACPPPLVAPGPARLVSWLVSGRCLAPSSPEAPPKARPFARRPARHHTSSFAIMRAAPGARDCSLATPLLVLSQSRRRAFTLPSARAGGPQTWSRSFRSPAHSALRGDELRGQASEQSAHEKRTTDSVPHTVAHCVRRTCARCALKLACAEFEKSVIFHAIMHPLRTSQNGTPGQLTEPIGGGRRSIAICRNPPLQRFYGPLLAAKYADSWRWVGSGWLYDWRALLRGERAEL